MPQGAAQTRMSMSEPAPLPEIGDLAPLNFRFVKVLRVRAAVRSLFPIVVALIVEAATSVSAGWLSLPALLAAVFIVLLVPRRQYRHWAYHMGRDRLQVVRGLLFHADTVVPFGRVQHIDVTQSPLERAWKLGSLTLHTAGTHNASVTLPGLTHDEALAMREAIRAHIRQDTM